MYARTRVRTPAGTPRTCARMRIYTTTGVNTTVVSTGKLNIHLNYCSYA